MQIHSTSRCFWKGTWTADRVEWYVMDRCFSWMVASLVNTFARVFSLLVGFVRKRYEETVRGNENNENVGFEFLLMKIHRWCSCKTMHRASFRHWKLKIFFFFSLINLWFLLIHWETRTFDERRRRKIWKAWKETEELKPRIKDARVENTLAHAKITLSLEIEF